MTAPACLHCLLVASIDLGEKLGVEDGSARRIRVQAALGSAVTTCAYVRAYGLPDVLGAICPEHAPAFFRELGKAPFGTPGKTS